MESNCIEIGKVMGLQDLTLNDAENIYWEILVEGSSRLPE
jgi:hypothetical protein